jgi:hypothetical protein
MIATGDDLTHVLRDLPAILFGVGDDLVEAVALLIAGGGRLFIGFCLTEALFQALPRFIEVAVAVEGAVPRNTALVKRPSVVAGFVGADTLAMISR